MSQVGDEPGLVGYWRLDHGTVHPCYGIFPSPRNSVLCVMLAYLVHGVGYVLGKGAIAVDSSRFHNHGHISSMGSIGNHYGPGTRAGAAARELSATEALALPSWHNPTVLGVTPLH